MNPEETIEPSFGYFNEHRNVKNSLSNFLQTMQSQYTLFSTLHGILPAYSTVCHFDPVLIAELSIMSTNSNALSTLILQALQNMNDFDANVFNENTSYNEQAVEIQNTIQKEMHTFYQQRCGRITAHPTSIDDTNKRVFRSLGGVHDLCKVFANWHFGDLGDDARVECKQSK